MRLGAIRFQPPGLSIRNPVSTASRFVPRSAIAHSMEEAREGQASIGFPIIIRPSFTLGGSGGGIAYNKEEFVSICEGGLDLSPMVVMTLLSPDQRGNMWTWRCSGIPAPALLPPL